MIVQVTLLLIALHQVESTWVNGCQVEKDPMLYSYNRKFLLNQQFTPIVYNIYLIQPPACNCPQPSPPNVNRMKPTSTKRPSTTTTSTTTATDIPPGMDLSPCVWAVVSCCSPNSEKFRSKCFELFGCQGSFWDVKPCSRPVFVSAVNTINMYYNGNSTGPIVT